jgi:LmbE family N-acetylglucosaminyl deacetylase
VVANGELGSMTQGKTETAQIRRQEAQRAAEVVGAEFYWLGIPDGFIFNTPETRMMMIDLIRQARPDLVICHNPKSDYHPDHVTSGQLVWDSRILVTVPNLVTAHPACAVIPEIVYMDTAGGINVVPDRYVDIGSDVETKRKMLACHESQADWVQRQYGMSLMELMESFTRTRGFQCGCSHAEAFCVPAVWPRKVELDGLL